LRIDKKRSDMKLKLLYILPLIAVLSSCLSNKNSNPTPVSLPSGTFTGTFTQLHYHLKATTTTVDTLRANIQLDMQLATGYKVTGDTSTVHAGSYGSYVIGSTNSIQFVDKTYPATGTPTKTHLAGVYQYYYDGSVFQLLGSNTADSLVYQYNLKKIN
jgi:hypothetical protein